MASPASSTDPDAGQHLHGRLRPMHEGSLWTSAGITAGIDLTLALVEADHGHAFAMAVDKALVLFLRRSGSQAQFSAAIRSSPHVTFARARAAISCGTSVGSGGRPRAVDFHRQNRRNPLRCQRIHNLGVSSLSTLVGYRHLSTFRLGPNICESHPVRAESSGRPRAGDGSRRVRGKRVGAFVERSRSLQY